MLSDVLIFIIPKISQRQVDEVLRKNEDAYVRSTNLLISLLTDIAGDSVIFPIDTFNSSKEAIVWCELFGCIGLISIRYFFGSSSSESESLDE